MKTFFKTTLLIGVCVLASMNMAQADNSVINVAEQKSLVSEFRQITLNTRSNTPTRVNQFVSHYPFECAQDSFERSLPDGFKVCQVFSEQDDSGMPLLMMGLDHDRVIAFVPGENRLKTKSVSCSYHSHRAPICFTRNATRSQRNYWLNLWNAPLKAAN